MNCIKCKQPISAARLRAMPLTKHCLNCSPEQRVKGHMTWEHKTAPTFNLVSESQHETLQRHARKGVHAQLPMSNKSAPRAVVFEAPQATIPDQPWDPSLSSIPRARCHPNRPKATSDGKCVACARAWYATRIKYRSPQ